MTRLIARLKRRADFLRVAQGCRKWVSPGLILQAFPTGAQTGRSPRGADLDIRVGFTTSRKIGKAVARNRARRRLRAAADRVIPAHAEGGYDYVVIGRGGTLNRPFGALVQDLETALRRVGAYRKGKPGPDGGEAGKE